jgi:serine/threonine protein kinase
MDAKGPNLRKIQNMTDKPFTVDCVNLIAIKLLNLLEKAHQAGVILTNLNPDKILVSRNLKDTSLFFVDFKSAHKVTIGASNILKFLKNKKKANFLYRSTHIISRCTAHEKKNNRVL